MSTKSYCSLHEIKSAGTMKKSEANGCNDWSTIDTSTALEIVVATAVSKSPSKESRGLKVLASSTVASSSSVAIAVFIYELINKACN